MRNEIGVKLATMDAVIAQCEARFGRHVKLLDHPILGPLSATQWRTLHLVHGRHHLKQLVSFAKWSPATSFMRGPRRSLGRPRTGQFEMVKFLLQRGAPKGLPDDPSWAMPLAWPSGADTTRSRDCSPNGRQT